MNIEFRCLKPLTSSPGPAHKNTIAGKKTSSSLIMKDSRLEIVPGEHRAAGELAAG